MKTILSCILMVLSPSFVMAQDRMVNGLSQLPMGVTDLLTLADQSNAGPEVFKKYGDEIELSDIADQIQRGSQIYTAGNSAIMVTEGLEPVLLIEQPDGEVNAMFICRILPICTETPD